MNAAKKVVLLLLLQVHSLFLTIYKYIMLTG